MSALDVLRQLEELAARASRHEDVDAQLTALAAQVADLERQAPALPPASARDTQRWQEMLALLTEASRLPADLVPRPVPPALAEAARHAGQPLDPALHVQLKEGIKTNERLVAEAGGQLDQSRQEAEDWRERARTVELLASVLDHISSAGSAGGRGMPA
jgi:hypothetical protein